MEPSAGTLVVKTPRFEAPDTVAEVRRLLPQAATRVVS